MNSAHRHTLSTAIAVLLSFMACQEQFAPAPAPVRSAGAAPSGSAVTSAASGSPATSASAGAKKKERADRTHRAARCGECHEKMYDEWVGTAHAKADDSPAFAAMQKLEGAAGCSRCHTPLELLGEPAAFAAKEAVTCEVCHRIESVSVATPFSKFELLRTHEVKFGPRCDPNEPYFHRARCNALFESAELCAGCHQLYQPLPGGGEPLPVHTEYAEFKASSYAKRGKTCQSCHMPGVRAELVTAEREREDVPDHGFLGHGGKLRGTALKGGASVTWTPDGVDVRLTLTNAGAAHGIPAGSPGRQLVVSVTARDEGGSDLARRELAFERRLVDDRGEPAPFFRAVRVDRDTRILPRETRREKLTLDAKGIAKLDLTLAFRSLDPTLARAIRAEESPDAVVFETSVRIGPARRGTRSVVLGR